MANIRTFKNIVDETLAWLDEVGDTDVTQTLAKHAVRAAHEKRLTEERWSFMLSPVTQLEVLAGKQSYTFPPNFSRLMYLKNTATGELLTEYTDQNVLNSGVNWTTDTAATANKFAMWGYWPVSVQPVATSLIAISSTNSGDNNAASVTLTNQNGVDETIYAGNSSVSTWNFIAEVRKSDNWVGTMTMTSDSGNTLNVELPATTVGYQYPVCYLLEIPAANETLEYRFYKQPNILENDMDIPNYPGAFSQLSVWDALCDMAAYNNYASSMVQYWEKKRDALVTAMQVATNQPQTINQHAVYTTYIPR